MLMLQHIQLDLQPEFWKCWDVFFLHLNKMKACSHMASFLHDRALVGICRWHGGLCLPTVVSGSIPGPI